MCVISPSAVATVDVEVEGGGDEDSSSTVPAACNSPGWRETPRDVELVPGRHVFMNCRSFIQHTRVIWVVNGMVDIMTSSLANRVRLFNRNHSMRLGPVRVEDGEITVGCRITALNYGVLPSPLATVTVVG